ncbi:MAG: alpha amylase C-terminal domain-containing protein, partial [Acidimicrobiales bacterium]
QHWGGYRVGLRVPGEGAVVLTTDDVRFGGATPLPAPRQAEDEPWQGRPHSTLIDLPPRSVTFLAPVPVPPEPPAATTAPATASKATKAAKAAKAAKATKAKPATTKATKAKSTATKAPKAR